MLEEAGNSLKEGGLEAFSLPDICRQNGKQHDLYLERYYENPLPDSAGGGFLKTSYLLPYPPRRDVTY